MIHSNKSVEAVKQPKAFTAAKGGSLFEKVHEVLVRSAEKHKPSDVMGHGDLVFRERKFWNFRLFYGVLLKKRRYIA